MLQFHQPFHIHEPEEDTTILLVDADGDCEEIVAIAAAQIGRQMRRASTSREAFLYLSEHIQHLAAMIVDVDPGANGLALLEAISSCAERPPMVVFTSLEESYMNPIAARHGASACLGKPLPLGRVHSVLETVCAEQRATSDYWGHPTAPSSDRGAKVKAAVRGITEKLSPAGHLTAKHRQATSPLEIGRTRKASSFAKDDKTAAKTVTILDL